ncbi:HTH_Tnp_Tc3_2 domain-containing protein [Trichonephila clavipes]|nr:HTH_Tnp_Tc3_2 domain-containing protein [Trichonephila clavipes]
MLIHAEVALQSGRRWVLYKPAQIRRFINVTITRRLWEDFGKRNVPEIVGSSGHEKVPARGKLGLERPGRPRGERIVRQALVDTTETRSRIRADTGVAIVPQTISRHLAEANLKSKRPFRALPLTPEHRQLRLQWCQARSMWNVTDWQKVVFSDESRFVLGTDDNRVRVWRRPCERTFPKWSPMCNFPARVAQDFLRHFQTLPWPACSPDLSPVESVHDNPRNLEEQFKVDTQADIFVP